ncbi:PREDICTED: F-box protein CPR30-like [Nicotiana attenuata]|uniref:F-box protein CPR30-like n=1 Tax=Nicotiana attenuata TaxID=49451 RepID=UPI0009053C12|nr:PREDICTED: F-box protein CPR30-like [Nicotiana attenuata]
MEILIRLPVESLLRFKCVGKYWYETITSPSFIEEHMNWSRKSPKIMIYDHVGCPSNDDSPLNPNPITLISVSDTVGVPENPDYLQEFIGMTHLLGSVDGLFLLERVIDGSIFNIFLALWNPATREVRSLPLPGFNLPSSFRQYRRQFGFGLNLMTNDYKVIWFRIFWEKIINFFVDQPYAAVYSYSKDSWRILQPENADIVLLKDILLIKHCIEALGTAYLNGAYYWLLKCEICNCSILSFDFGNEVFTEIEGPDAPRPFNHWHLKLILLDDSLALFSVADWDRFEHDIWEIWEKNKSSFKEKKMDIHTKLMSKYLNGGFGAFLWQTLPSLSLLVNITTSNFSLPWWGVILACVIAIFFTLPSGIITAITNQGWMLPSYYFPPRFQARSLWKTPPKNNVFGSDSRDSNSRVLLFGNCMVVNGNNSRHMQQNIDQHRVDLSFRSYIL